MVCSRCLTNVISIKQAQILCILPLPPWVCQFHTPGSPHGHKMAAQAPSLTPSLPQAHRREKPFAPSIPSMCFH